MIHSWLVALLGTLPKQTSGGRCFFFFFFRPDRLEWQLRTFHSATRCLTLAKQRGNPSPAGNYAPVIKAAAKRAPSLQIQYRRNHKSHKKKAVVKAIFLKLMTSYVGHTCFHFPDTFVELRNSSSWQPDMDTHGHTLSHTLGFWCSLTPLVQLGHSAVQSNSVWFRLAAAATVPPQAFALPECRNHQRYPDVMII